MQCCFHTPSAPIEGYRTYVHKDYAGFNLKSVHNSNPVFCARLCDETIGCAGTVFYFPRKICFLKSKMATSGKNFKTLKTTNLYYRIGGPGKETLFFLNKINLSFFLTL